MSLKHWFYILPLRFRSIFRRSQVERELEDELQYHLDLRIEENLARAMSAEEARRTALIALGGIDQRKEECRDARGLGWLIELQRNLGFAVRLIWKQKALSLIVIGLLAFASAANTAIFSAINFAYLKSFPYPHSDRLVYVNTSGGYYGYDPESFYRYRNENHSFEVFGSFNPDNRNYSRKGEARPINILVVTYNFASVFPYQPVLGRGFLEKEENRGEPRVVMLSHRFWQREFGGSASALGETLKLDGEVHTVVGVLPSNADFPYPADLWVLFQKGPGYTFRGIGRLKEGVSLEQGQQDLRRIHKSILETRAMSDSLAPPRLRSLREALLGIFGIAGQVVPVVAFAAGMVLLTVCFNVAGIMLARSESRAHEMGIRAALGASRAGIVRQLLTESLLLAIPGVLSGLVLGQALLKMILLMTDAPSWVRLTPDVALLAFCVLLTGATTIFFGLAPALRAGRVDVRDSLHEGSSTLSVNGATRCGLKLLVVGEIALAIILLVGAGLLLRAWQKMLAVDPGFRADHVFTFNVKLPPSRYYTLGKISFFFQTLIEKIRQIPGMAAASGCNVLPMGGYNQFSFEAEGVPPLPASSPDSIIPTYVIFPEYFKAMGIPLLSGRDFNEEDRRGRNSVAIVDQRFARRYWPGADPVGRRIRIQAQNVGQGEWYKSSGLYQWLTIVGFASEVAHFGLDRPAQPAVYIPYHKWERSHYFVLVRSKMNPVGIVAPIRSQLSKLDPDVAMFSPMMMTEVVGGSTYYRRVFSMVMTIFAAGALMIAIAGLYGIVNYTVSRRTHEIGIRIALGATRGQVLSMILGGGMRLVIIGAALGLAGAFVASRALSSMLFGISRLDVPTYFMVGAVLLIAVVLATLVPARRAASIEPARALRSE